MVAMKRAPAAASTAGKRRKADAKRGQAALLEKVNRALKEDSTLPDGHRKMLLACIPHSLAQYKNTRDAQQTQVVGWIQEALENAQTKLDEGLTLAKAETEAARRELEAKEAALKEAEESTVRCKATKAERFLSKEEADQAEVKAKEVHEEAAEAQTALLEELVSAEEKKEALEELVNGPLAEMRAVQSPKRRAETFAAGLKKHGVEEAIRTSLPVLLAKEPSERTAFEAVVLAHLDQFLAARLDDFSRQLVIQDPAKAEKEAAIREASKAAEAAQAAASAAEAALEEATLAVKAADKAEKAAAASKKSAAAGLKSAEAAAQAAAKALEDFRSDILGAFAELRDTEEPPEEEHKEQAAQREEAEADEEAGEPATTPARATRTMSPTPEPPQTRRSSSRAKRQ